MPGRESVNLMYNQYRWPYWLLPILAVLLITPWSADIDLSISHYFYDHSQFQSSAFMNFVYKYGIIPAWITVAIAFVLLFFRQWRLAGVYLLLTLAIGSGVIVHALLKENWGRPRPKQITEFGGEQEFRSYYQPHFNVNAPPSKSFSSGHVSVGFYFFALIILGTHYRMRSLRYLGIFLTLLLGGVLSYVRIAQGGHFFTDIIFSALIMWLTSLLLYYFLFIKDTMGLQKQENESERHILHKK